jgi:hypothetical protein
LILGREVPDAVRNEYDEAVRLNKPVFAFVKDISRSNEAEQLLDRVKKQSKYAIFKSTSEVSELVKSSLDGFFHRLVRDNQLQKDNPEVMRALTDIELAKQLREYARQLLDRSRVSFEEEISHYLELVPGSLQDISRFYIPMKAKLPFGVSEKIDTILAKNKRVVILGAAVLSSVLSV